MQHSEYEIKKLKTILSNPKLVQNKLYLPFELEKVPFLDEKGIILKVTNVPIRNLDAAYNASIVEHEEGYLMVFRYDTFLASNVVAPYPFSAHLGLVKLDKNFQQTQEEFSTIDTKNTFSEDPRLIKVNNELFIIFNALVPHSKTCRSMHLANINPKTFATNYVTKLDLGFQRIEKNWPPFEYIDEHNRSNFLFEYQLNPHTILNLKDPSANTLTHLKIPIEVSYTDLKWQDCWGMPRGGTPPKKIGNEYLAFFHSSFKDKNDHAWYLMGAYTFEAKPPFRITAISPYPILFKGIYDSPIFHTAPPKTRAIFPSGFVIEKRNNQELIHVSCGENDTSIKIITFDKNALLKNLKKL